MSLCFLISLLNLHALCMICSHQFAWFMVLMAPCQLQMFMLCYILPMSHQAHPLYPLSICYYCKEPSSFTLFAIRVGNPGFLNFTLLCNLVQMCSCMIYSVLYNLYACNLWMGRILPSNMDCISNIHSCHICASSPLMEYHCADFVTCTVPTIYSLFIRCNNNCVLLVQEWIKAFLFNSCILSVF